jgi:serine protease Do
VRPDSVAARLGLHAEDIVVGMNGRAIGHSADLTRALLAWRRLEGTRVTVFRDGGYRELRIDAPQ